MPLDLDDALEAEVGVGSTNAMHGHGREPAGLTQGCVSVPSPDSRLQPAGAEADSLARPAPGDVHVVTERDGEPGAAPAWRVEPQVPAQPLERRIEWVEARRRRGEPAVLVARPIPLLDPRKVEERLCEVVALRPPPGVDVSPGLLRVGKVADAQAPGPERVEHPAGAPFDGRRYQGSAALTTRASCVAPGLGSSSAKRGST